MNQVFTSVTRLLNLKMFVHGKSSNTFEVINPATLEKIVSIPRMCRSEVRSVIVNAGSAQEAWKGLTQHERGQTLRRWLDLVLENKNALGTLITLESGKTLKEGLAEVLYGASYIDWYSEEGRRVYGEVIPNDAINAQTLLYREPIGPCALITPWNFPLAMILRKASAALAAGCTVVVKPSEETPLSALALAQLGDRAGIPRGVFSVVTTGSGETPDVVEELCTNPIIQGVSFTGSCEVGKKVYKMSSSGVKRITLELGGNAPFIVFPSADMNVVMQALDLSKFRNNGQACIATNRVLVHSDRIDEFLKRSIQLIEGKKVENGLMEGVVLGPLINQSAVSKVERHLSDSLSKGGKVLTGGKRIGKQGYFYAPTLMSGLRQDMIAWREETFGPVISVKSFRTEEEAILLANDVSQGFAAYVMSSNYEQIHRVTSKLQSSVVGINQGLVPTASVPYGGMKESGIGREGGRQGLDEYLQYKIISLGRHK